MIAPAGAEMALGPYVPISWPQTVGGSNPVTNS